jgi:mRNA-degrading endonuclease RelE of RelBE toxin-antitoxin system
MVWSLKEAETFEKQFLKNIPKQHQSKLRHRLKNLRESPFVGRPLGVTFFRELKIGKWRIYFLVYETKKLVFLVGVSNKKLQQQRINEIKNQFKSLEQSAKKIT